MLIGFYKEKTHAAETRIGDSLVTHACTMEAMDELLVSANQMNRRETASRYGIQKKVEAAIDEESGVLGDG